LVAKSKFVYTETSKALTSRSSRFKSVELFLSRKVPKMKLRYCLYRSESSDFRKNISWNVSYFISYKFFLAKCLNLIFVDREQELQSGLKNDFLLLLLLLFLFLFLLRNKVEKNVDMQCTMEKKNILCARAWKKRFLCARAGKKNISLCSQTQLANPKRK